MLFMHVYLKGSWNAGAHLCNNESSTKEMFNTHEWIFQTLHSD